jgi:prepilin-type N-terminal cleavage/methylation domain-containing protein
MMRLRDRDSDGFTLVEVLVAMIVFSIVTLGIVPLLAGSIKGAIYARSSTVGKNVALRAMERARGLPYHVAFSSQNTKVDVLDLYYPDDVTLSATQTYAATPQPIFTSTCNSATLSNPACPRTLPVGHTLVFEAKFVRSEGRAVQTNTAQPFQTYTAEPPLADYAWNVVGKDSPATQIVELTVRASWVAAGTARSFQMRSLLGERRVVPPKVRALGRVDYGVSVTTSFVDGTGQVSDLVLVGGASESRLDSRLVSTADQVVRAAQVRLLEETSALFPQGRDLAAGEGATEILHAEPDSGAIPGGTFCCQTTVAHPNLVPALNVARIDDTNTNSLEVKVGGQLPLAKGAFGYEDDDDAARALWVMNQADTTAVSPLKLTNDDDRKMFWVRSDEDDALNGNTRAQTYPTTDVQSGVAATASVDAANIRLLPTEFISSGFGASKSVVFVNDFTANVSCNAHKNPLAASAAIQWSANLRYWSDTDGDNVADGTYAPAIPLGSAQGTDNLQAIKSSNPVVYDAQTGSADIHLFEERDPSTGAVVKQGYLTDWRSAVGSAGTVAADGRSTLATLEGAIRIDTVATNPLVSESALSVSVGKMSCEAEDNR